MASFDGTTKYAMNKHKQINCLSWVKLFAPEHLQSNADAQHRSPSQGIHFQVIQQSYLVVRKNCQHDRSIQDQEASGEARAGLWSLLWPFVIAN